MRDLRKKSESALYDYIMANSNWREEVQYMEYTDLANFAPEVARFREDQFDYLVEKLQGSMYENPSYYENPALSIKDLYFVPSDYPNLLIASRRLIRYYEDQPYSRRVIELLSLFSQKTIAYKHINHLVTLVKIIWGEHEQLERAGVPIDTIEIFIDELASLLLNVKSRRSL